MGLTYGAEITHPIPEETSSGLLMTLGQVVGSILIIYPNMYILAGMFAVGTIFCFLIQDSDRYKIQNEAEKS